jgi:hypothetical protein
LKHTDQFDSLQPIFWQWAENINKCAPDDDYLDPVTNKIDENVNEVADITFAKGSYGFLKRYRKMSNLLREKKLAARRYSLAK